MALERVTKFESNKKPSGGKNARLEEFLNDNFEFRYNTIKCLPEYRPAVERGRTNFAAWQPVDDYYVHTLIRTASNQHHIETNSAVINSLLSSDFSIKVDPIAEFFHEMKPINKKTDHIKALADTVKVHEDDKEFWYPFLKKWLVACVSNALTPQNCTNHTMLILTGEQGRFKTTWLDNLCPKSLGHYLYTGKIQPENKDTQTYIAEYFIINIDDQLHTLNKKDANLVKNMVTLPTVKYRRPYDKYIKEYPHIASFVASVNGNEILADATGARRFLPFEVLEIDINDAKAINMDAVWNQAHQLWLDDFHYWFNEKEVKALNKRNERFNVSSVEEEMILELYENPHADDFINDLIATKHLPVASIIKRMTDCFGNGIRITPHRVGSALKKLGFIRSQKNRKYGYDVFEKEI